MTAPFRYRGLGEITGDELAAMLREDETIFVEHKADLGGDGYQVAKAASSFANTLGGWVLVGVRDGAPTEGLEDGWEPPDDEPFIDYVRMRLREQIDPLPFFSAGIRRLEGDSEWAGRRVGVIRVYESTDTPHIMRKPGIVFIREAGEDRRYQAERIRSHLELVRLAERGRVARADAAQRFEEGALPLTEGALGIEYTTAATGTGRAFRTIHASHAAVTVRMTPLSLTPRFEAWTKSEAALARITSIVERLTGQKRSLQAPIPHPQGVHRTSVDGGPRALDAWGSSYKRVVTAVADAGGMIGLRIAFAVTGDEQRAIQAGTDARDEFLAPGVIELVRALEDEDFVGRWSCRVDLMRFGDILFAYGPGGEVRPASHVPLGGEITVPGLDVGGNPDSDLDAQLTDWAYSFGRACSLVEFA
jgi:Putative DNA-binding domain